MCKRIVTSSTPVGNDVKAQDVVTAIKNTLQNRKQTDSTCLNDESLGRCPREGQRKHDAQAEGQRQRRGERQGRMQGQWQSKEQKQSEEPSSHETRHERRIERRSMWRQHTKRNQEENPVFGQKGDQTLCRVIGRSNDAGFAVVARV